MVQKPAKLKERLPSAILSQGHFEGIIPLPAFPGHFPHMVADLRNLELVPIDVRGSQTGFERIASVDSPFRELVAWAYMQTTARPGLPERDCDRWCKEIINSLKQVQSDGQA
jgi:hypothetical protein